MTTTKPLPLAVSLALACLTQSGSWAADSTTLPTVHVEDSAIDQQGQTVKADKLNQHQAQSPDASQLLRDLPGISLHPAGGFSALPVQHGLADDRLQVQHNGVALNASCPNHMNSPLSYVDPHQVSNATAYPSTAPVSLGGDNIGGVIVMNPVAPLFSDSSATVSQGELGAWWQSNGNGYGSHASAQVANDHLSLGYSGSTARADNYIAARNFKAAGPAASGQNWLNGDTVGSSAYQVTNQSLTLAGHQARSQWDLTISSQHSPYEGFPNQRMDMTNNHAEQFVLHLQQQYDWGELDARLYNQYVRHSMQFGDDKQYQYGSAPGMPMETASHTQGLNLQASLPVGLADTVKLGGEWQHYRLDDWWPPSGTGGMSPNTFWNINNGQRNRLDAFAQWQHQFNPAWQSDLGLRYSTVNSNAGNVQGYNTGIAYIGHANAFNTQPHQQIDRNIDLSAALRYQPDNRANYELAYARKTRSPNLYERYTWSSFAMAAVMNNFVGDGNGYVGNLNLKPEVAHNLGFTANWHDAEQRRWQLRLAPFYSYVENYIDARRISSTSTNQFITLQYINQNAELYGMDLSAELTLADHAAYGQWRLNGKLDYTRGKNLSTGDNLYNIMPFNGLFSLEQRLAGWQNTLEWQVVSAKRNVSAVRNEIQTPGYGLLNLHTRYQWHHLTLDMGIDNLLNHFYTQPLGGTYTGQGRTMSINGIPWGVGVPGPARSLYTAVNYTF
ncbi:TonB-dependent receptor [Paludibacterium sp. THUN1379]|uniref:TonB-dependent receptor n=1 Tax=Paludibacterium sp. THUN1379 TaxID=3112107 RepID=UPI003088150D|nr:TonB-dependent receptor [Paludibacterium sp. THUN1379]